MHKYGHTNEKKISQAKYTHFFILHSFFQFTHLFDLDIINLEVKTTNMKSATFWLSVSAAMGLSELML